MEVRKRKSKNEEQGEEPALDEVDNDFHVEKEKKDLAHLSVAMEMEEIPLEKSVDKPELENKEEEVNYERKEELEEKDKMVEKRELPTNKISPNLITDERIIIKEPEPIKSTRHGVKICSISFIKLYDLKIILDPVAIEQPSKMDVKRPFTQNISNLAGHQRALSQESAAEASPEMIERLRMLSAEQFGMLETNRRRLEHERRQLRELGVI